MPDPTPPETITLRLPSRLELLAVLDRVALTVCERMEFDEDTSDLVISGEDDRAVHHAVMELTPEQREAIQLAYFAGLSQSEIAVKTASPLGTVKMRVKLAMAKLAELLGDENT